MKSLGENYALRVFTGGLVEVLGDACLLSHAQTKGTLVLVPVGYLLACHTALDGSLCYGSTYLRDESWVYGFRYEIVGTEGEVVYVVHLVNYVWYRLLCKICDGVNGSYLHFLVDGAGVDVQSTTEDVRETDDVVYLVWIVGTACRHEYVRACCHGVFV